MPVRIEAELTIKCTPTELKLKTRKTRRGRENTVATVDI